MNQLKLNERGEVSELPKCKIEKCNNNATTTDTEFLSFNQELCNYKYEQKYYICKDDMERLNALYLKCRNI